MVLFSSLQFGEHVPPPGHPERPERAEVFDERDLPQGLTFTRSVFKASEVEAIEVSIGPVSKRVTTPRVEEDDGTNPQHAFGQGRGD